MSTATGDAVWSVLLEVARGAEGDAPNAFRAAHFPWGALMEEALRQKMLPLVAARLLEGPSESACPKFVRAHLHTALAVNRHRNHFLRAAAREFGAALSGSGVRFVVTKGVSFDGTIYEPGLRYMNDADFLVHADDRNTVREIQESLGYQPGLYDEKVHAVVPHPRKEQIIYATHPDHLPIVARLTGDPVVPCVHMDVANSLTWHESPWEVPVEDALTSHVEFETAEGGRLPCFAPAHQFLFTALHLYREAWFSRWVAWEQDVNLAKFVDMGRLWTRYGRELRESLSGLLSRATAAEPLAWVCAHTDELLGTNMLRALQLQNSLRPELLDAAQGPDGIRHWNGSMLDRMRTRAFRADSGPDARSRLPAAQEDR